jgi:hypothetical protein
VPVVTNRQRAYARRQLVGGRLVSLVGIHGTHGNYSNNGCRCEACCRAHREMVATNRQRRHKRTAENGGVAPTGRHGTTTYSNWGCHCRICVDAWNTYSYHLKSQRREQVNNH